MTNEDVDVAFIPREGLSRQEREIWRRIVVTALERERGSLSVVFTNAGDRWLLRGLFWFKPGAFFPLASTSDLAPLRSRVIDALQGAGKSVVLP